MRIVTSTRPALARFYDLEEKRLKASPDFKLAGYMQ